MKLESIDLRTRATTSTRFTSNLKFVRVLSKNIEPEESSLYYFSPEKLVRLAIKKTQVMLPTITVQSNI